MNKKQTLIAEAVGYLDTDLLEEHIDKKRNTEETMEAKKKRNPGRWIALAACIALVVCAIPVVRFVMKGGNDKGPVTIDYESLAEAQAQLGIETLYTKMGEEKIGRTAVSYEEKGDREANFDKPLQLVLYGNGTNGVTGHYYVLFGKTDVNDSKIGGYEEQGLTKEVNGVTVHYSVIFDGANHTQAKFVWERDLYVIDLVSKETIKLDPILETLLG